MGVFDKIRDAIWGKAEAATIEEGSAAATAPESPASAGAPPTPTSSSAPSSTPAPMSAVDVGAVLDRAVKDSGQTLDWKHSIVDLMKALGLDSSLSHRKELATELGYGGDMSDSAAMNIWLHAQVIEKLRANGGKLPAGL